jgi:hypothetical protein
MAVDTTALREPVLADPGPLNVELTRLGFVISVGVRLLLEVARSCPDPRRSTRPRPAALAPAGCAPQRSGRHSRDTYFALKNPGSGRV